MQTIINTIQGTFVVPAEKQAELIFWLQNNAVKLGTVKEENHNTQPGYFTNQLLNEQVR
jgi:hypothetical protein